MHKDILEFQGEFRWLSNFWPCKVALDGMWFPSIENAYQAAKFPIVNREYFLFCTAPQSKQFARRMKPVSNWNEIKVEIMQGLIEQKFAPGTALANKLIETGDCLIEEGNTWGDTFWGICRGVGRNTLGKLIMAQRCKLQEQMGS